MVKLELFDNTSMLQVLDEPELPLFDSRPKLSFLLFISIIVSLITSSALVILRICMILIRSKFRIFERKSMIVMLSL